MLKQLFSSLFTQRVAGALTGAYIRLAGASGRWTFVGKDIVAPIWAGKGPAILCFWHGRLALGYKGWTAWAGSQPVKVLISHSRDGEVIASAMRAIHARTIRGSSAKGDKRKGGVIAMREMLRHLESGGCVVIAPDGPRGPRMRAQIGVIQLAKRAQAPIVVLGWGVKGEKILRSWDRFAAPPLFGRGALVWGGPIHVAPDASAEAMEDARLTLENELQRVTHEACAMVGAAAIDAEPIAPSLERAGS